MKAQLHYKAIHRQSQYSTLFAFISLKYALLRLFDYLLYAMVHWQLKYLNILGIKNKKRPKASIHICHLNTPRKMFENVRVYIRSDLL